MGGGTARVLGAGGAARGRPGLRRGGPLRARRPGGRRFGGVREPAPPGLPAVGPVRAVAPVRARGGQLRAGEIPGLRGRAAGAVAGERAKEWRAEGEAAVRKPRGVRVGGQRLRCGGPRDDPAVHRRVWDGKSDGSFAAATKPGVGTSASFASADVEPAALTAGAPRHRAGAAAANPALSTACTDGRSDGGPAAAAAAAAVSALAAAVPAFTAAVSAIACAAAAAAGAPSTPRPEP